MLLLFCLIVTVKRYYRPEWGDDWQSHFTVDRLNGQLGHELKFENQKQVNSPIKWHPGAEKFFKEKNLNIM